MTPRKPRYTGPEVRRDGPGSGVWISSGFYKTARCGFADLPELISRLQKFAPQPARSNLALTPDDIAEMAQNIAGKPKRKAKAKR